MDASIVEKLRQLRDEKSSYIDELQTTQRQAKMQALQESKKRAKRLEKKLEETKKKLKDEKEKIKLEENDLIEQWCTTYVLQ